MRCSCLHNLLPRRRSLHLLNERPMQSRSRRRGVQLFSVVRDSFYYVIFESHRVQLSHSDALVLLTRNITLCRCSSSTSCTHVRVPVLLLDALLLLHLLPPDSISLGLQPPPDSVFAVAHTHRHSAHGTAHVNRPMSIFVVSLSVSASAELLAQVRCNVALR